MNEISNEKWKINTYLKERMINDFLYSKLKKEINKNYELIDIKNFATLHIIWKWKKHDFEITYQYVN